MRSVLFNVKKAFFHLYQNSFGNTEKTLRSITFYIFLFLISTLFNQSVLSESNREKIEASHLAKFPREPRRGKIFDREDKALASNRLSNCLKVVKSNIDKDMYEVFSRFLSENLDIPYEDIISKFSENASVIFLMEDIDDESFTKVKRFRQSTWKRELAKFYDHHPQYRNHYKDYKIFEEKIQKCIVTMEPQTISFRTYPSGPLTSHLIGYYTRINDDIFNPASGIELMYKDQIIGRKGRVSERRDHRDRAIPGNEENVKDLVHGYDFNLTVSLDLQTFVYSALKKRVEETGAKGGSVIVMHAPTGEIHAMVSYPSFDPVNYKEYLGEPDDPQSLPRDQYRLNPMHNLNTQFSYEPGSVLKPFIAAWALEKDKIKPDETFEILPGGLKFDWKKDPIRDSHAPNQREFWTVDKIIYKSSNQGMAQIALKMGREDIIESLKAFRFGEKALGIMGEHKGNINENLCEINRNSPSWSKAREVTVSYGKGVTVTPIQLVSAMNIFANNGYYIPPKIILKITSPTGEIIFDEPTEPVRVLSQQTQDLMKDMLRKATHEPGCTGSSAVLANYTIAGKTGTAEKALRGSRGYDNRRHIASFVGFGPFDYPQYTIVVVLDEPTTKWGGSSCGPLFREIFQKLVIKDGIPPTIDIMFANAD